MTYYRGQEANTYIKNPQYKYLLMQYTRNAMQSTVIS